MVNSIKTGDKVTIISGAHKGKTGKIVKMDKKNNRAMIEGIGIRERHIAPNRLNPNGSKKDIHVGIHVSNLRKEGDK